MSKPIPPNTTIIGQENAFQQWTHFLDERGIHKHKIALPAPVPILVPSQAESDRYEPAWMHTEYHTKVHIDVAGEQETLTSRRRKVGELLLATMLHTDGTYEFAPINELTAKNDIPIYTAAWLSRYVRTWRRDFFGALNYPIGFRALKYKPSMALLNVQQVKHVFPMLADQNRWHDEELLSIALDERAKRLARQVIIENPHLETWYKQRGIAIQDEATNKKVMAVLHHRRTGAKNA